jgi:hypothetical protein
MATLAEAFFRLDQPGKYQAHLFLCQYALGVWRAYIWEHGPISYVDTVVGAQHTLDHQLPHDALLSVEEGKDLTGVAARYAEPIAALQDDDLEFPDHIEFAYYAIYNLFCKYIRGAAIDDWLIVNQALSSETDSSKWEGLLYDVLQADQFKTVTWRPPWEPAAPWQFVSELIKEVGPGHPFAQARTIAVGRRFDCDDVLFFLPSEPPAFAVVHLTWRGAREEPGWPSMRWYESIEDWAESCMALDHIDYGDDETD